MTINVLGTEYEIVYGSSIEYPALKNADGYCDGSIKLIVVDDMKERDADLYAVKDIAQYREIVLRHEIIHAFLYESGLHACSDWAINEEIVDWIAMQLPKINEAVSQAGYYGKE